MLISTRRLFGLSCSSRMAKLYFINGCRCCRLKKIFLRPMFLAISRKVSEMYWRAVAKRSSYSYRANNLAKFASRTRLTSWPLLAMIFRLAPAIAISSSSKRIHWLSLIMILQNIWSKSLYTKLYWQQSSLTWSTSGLHNKFFFYQACTIFLASSASESSLRICLSSSSIGTSTMFATFSVQRIAWLLLFKLTLFTRGRSFSQDFVLVNFFCVQF